MFELLRYLSGIVRGWFLLFDGLGILQSPGQRDREKSDIAGLELLKNHFSFIRRGSIHTRGEQDNRFLALNLCEPFENFGNTGSQIQ